MNSLVTLIQACLLGAAFLLALSYFGFGVTRFLLPPSLREQRGPVTPFVGLALVVVWDYVALFFQFNLTTATILLLGVVTVVNGAALLRPPSHLPPPSHGEEVAGPGGRAPSSISLAGWGLFASALVTFLAAMAPLVRYGYITIIGENWDYEFYLPLADALRTTTTAALDRLPANPLMNVILSRHIIPLPMGFSYLQSSLDVLFRLDAIDSFAVLLAVVHALGVVSAFVFFRATLKMSPLAALGAAGLLGLNGLLLWAAYWNFGLHLTSLALLPIAITFGVETLIAPSGRNGVRALALAALFLAALNVTFHPTLIFAQLPLAGMGLYILIARRERVRTLALGAGLVILAAGLSFPTLFHIKDFLREYYGREPLATGLREFIPLTDAYGLSQYSLESVVGHTIPTPALYDLATRVWGIAAPVFLLLALAASGFALWQVRRYHPTLAFAQDSTTPREGRRAIWCIMAGASVFYVAVFRLPFLHPYPYGYLKSLTLVSFVLIALSVQGVADCRLAIRNYEFQIRNAENLADGQGGEKRLRILKFFYVLPVLFVVLTILTFGVTLEQYFKPAPPFFNSDDLRLRTAPLVLRQGAAVFLTDRGEVQKIPMGLAAYALREFPLYGDVSTGYGDLNNSQSGAVYDFALLARGEDPGARGYQAAPLWMNDKFALYPKVTDVLYHRTLNARIMTPGALTLTVGASQIVTGTQAVSPAIATRGLSIALASFVPQTATLTWGGKSRSVALTPGLSVYRIPEAQLPGPITITAQDAMQFVETRSVGRPGELPQADANLFAPWVEMREAGGGVESNTPAQTLLVRCTSASGTDLNARCFVANPGGAAMRWEYVVRGTPKGTREDQELVRRAASGDPRQKVDIQADAPSGRLSLGFDDRPPAGFSSPVVKDGNYRAALEVFRGDVLVARIDLYTFVVSKDGTLLRRESPLDPPLVVVQP